MAIHSHLNPSTRKLTITVYGGLTEDDYEEFVQALLTAPKDSHFLIDLSELETIDSSGLGMLFMLHSAHPSSPRDVTLVGCSPQIKHSLEALRADEMFSIH